MCVGYAGNDEEAKEMVNDAFILVFDKIGQYFHLGYYGK